MSPQRIARMVVAFASLLMLAAAPASAQVRVGSKNFTEQFIVAEIYAQALRPRASRSSARSTSAAR
jgi:glycine betaine/choline ABC-type transport system substrate-binding protein